TFIGYAGDGYAFSLRMGDLNHDGLQDLAVGNEYGISVLTRTGSGGFQPIVLAQGADYVTIDFDWAGVKSFAVGDVDGDGTADIVAGDADYDLVTLHNTGDGHLLQLEPM